MTTGRINQIAIRVVFVLSAGCAPSFVSYSSRGTHNDIKRAHSTAASPALSLFDLRRDHSAGDARDEACFSLWFCNRRVEELVVPVSRVVGESSGLISLHPPPAFRVLFSHTNQGRRTHRGHITRLFQARCGCAKWQSTTTGQLR